MFHSLCHGHAVFLPTTFSQPPPVYHVCPQQFFDSLVDTLEMANQKLYIKGYKLDPEKIRKTFSRKPDLLEATCNIYWYQPIVDYFPEDAYRYVGCGLEPDGHYNLQWR